MAAVHKLTPDLYENNFDLIALHCSLQDYALAYSLNLRLKSKFRRRWKDLEISGTITVPVFEWKDEINDRYWTFFTNKGKGEKTVADKGLFRDESSYSNYHLVAEHRDVDYFLKIEEDGSAIYRLAEVEKTISLLLEVPKIITAYTVETNKLKSRNNLIF